MAYSSESSAADAFVIPGLCTIVASHGIEYAPQTRAIQLDSSEYVEIEFSLRRILHRKSGWVCGDHHVHSWEQDGAYSPMLVASAARAEGLDYIFLTDEGCGEIMNYSVPGKFLALPGQEGGSVLFHVSALNIKRRIATQFANYQVIQQIEDVTAQVRAQSTPENKTAIMLNHPSIINWWIVDGIPEVKLVETNCSDSLKFWFRRLNFGRRVTALWTTDSHDAVLCPPGARRAYVYVGDGINPNSVIEALEAGRCFNTCSPGALLYFYVNDELPGGTTRPKPDGKVSVEVRCEASKPIDRVEVIAEEKVIKGIAGERVIKVIYGEGASALKANFDISIGDAQWLLATAYVVEAPGSQKFVAFTNPVYIEKKK